MVHEIRGILSAGECEEIINSSKFSLQQSKVASGVSIHRKSQNTWLNYYDSPTLIKVRMKVASYIQENYNIYNLTLEDPQVIKYTPGEYYNDHVDYFKNRTRGEYQRHSSFLFYLNDNYTGGETVFPKLEKTIIPELGKMVVFKNLDDNNVPIKETLHRSNNITSGEKWLMVIWNRIML